MEKEEIRLMRNEYHRKWRAKNPDKVKAINERFYAKLKDKQNEERSNK